MSLFELFVRRPVLSTVLSLLVVLIGFVSYTRLTVREYPNIDEPIVSVRTDYRGASAEIIETQVTQILENSIAGIEGIEIINSTSRQERSQISVRFRPDVDPDVAASDVRDRVSRVRGRMPDEIDEPIIAKVEADAQPVMYLSLTSSRHSPLELTDFAAIVERLWDKWGKFSAVPLSHLLSYPGRIALAFDEPIVVFTVSIFAISRGSDAVSGSRSSQVRRSADQAWPITPRPSTGPWGARAVTSMCQPSPSGSANTQGSRKASSCARATAR